MRGKAKQPFPLRSHSRITPAYAGKSFCCLYQKLCNGDHPRLCGEKQRQRVPTRARTGSPPPMRGKDVPIVYDNGAIGITPAYAGKRIQRVFFLIRFQDHPRLCGEKLVVEIAHSGDRGSPPPMRGKAASNRVDMDSAGITPAYAGKSLKRRRIDFKGMDHPRLCGEKLTA